MTPSPKEKAKELYLKYHEPFFDKKQSPTVSELIAIQHFAKQCALIAIREIIEATKTEVDRPEFCGTVYNKHYIEVKQELEKL